MSSATLYPLIDLANAQSNPDNFSSASLGSSSLPGPNPDQQALLQYCKAASCTPPITYVARDIYQRPFAPLPCPALPCDEFILQLKPELLRTTSIQAVAGQISKLPGVFIHQVYDLPTYKAIAIRSDRNNSILDDARFLKFNLPNNIKAGELNQFEGHVAQLKWNQTLPEGLKRTTQDNKTATNATSTGLEQIQPVVGQERRKVNVDIAVLDTGISLIHPDLNVYRNVSFVEGTPSGNDDNGHGSHVAGIAAAKDNSIGIVGVAPGARLWAIKVCDSTGQCKISNQIKGIEYAIKHANEIDVLNISIENPNSPALNNIVAEAVKAGITVVASAGNWARNTAQFSPANSPVAITVSAMGDSDGKCGGLGKPMVLPEGNSTAVVKDDTFAYFSNFGPSVKLAAPGVDIFSTFKGTGYALDSGTSMAAPYVTGAAAVYKAQFPKATPFQVLHYLQSTGSSPTTICDGLAHGYFSGAPTGSSHEPLLFRGLAGIQRPSLVTQNNISKQ